MPKWFERDVLKRLFAIQAPIAVLVAIIIWGAYYFESRTHLAELMTSERTIHLMHEDEIVRAIRISASGLVSETASNELLEFLDSGNSHHLDELADEWRAMLESSGYFYSIRYIDEDGRERLRVNFEGGKARVVPVPELQGKSHRYYYMDVMKLPRGAIYVSPIDLSSEYGQLESPGRPILRFATTVFDSGGRRRGFVIMNYLGDELIERFRSRHAEMQGIPMLLDRNGSWIIAPDPQKSWSFMYDNNQAGSFPDEHPELWAIINSSENGQFMDDSGLYTYSCIHPLREGWMGRPMYMPNDDQEGPLADLKGYYWKSVSHVPMENIRAMGAPLRRDLIVLYIALFMITGGVSHWVARLWSERQAATARLSEAKAEWDRTFDSISDPILLLDTQMRIHRANLAMSGFAGISARKLAGIHCHDIICNNDQPPESCQCLRANEDGLPHSLEIYKPSLGRYFHVAASPVFGMGGQITGFVLYMRDITRRRKIEQELAYSESFLKSVIENEPECVKLIDEECRLISMNPTGLAMIGAEEADALIGQSVLPIVMEEHRQAFADFTREVCRGKGGSLTFEIQGMKGARRWLESHAVPFHDTRNNRTVLLGVTRDITERKLAEDGLRQALADKDVLIKEVHHRVKNNLMIIQSLLKLQQSEVHDEGSRKRFEESSNRVRSMGMIHEMLYKSGDLKSIDFAEYAGGLVRSLVRGSAFGATNVRLDFEVEHLPMDVDTIIPCGLILNELVTNALKYAFPSGKKGVLSVKCSKGEDGIITLAVKDNGPGLPDGFELYGSETLGMRLISALASQIKAEVEVSDEGGTSFTLRFKEHQNSEA